MKLKKLFDNQTCKLPAAHSLWVYKNVELKSLNLYFIVDAYKSSKCSMYPFYKPISQIINFNHEEFKG